ncbi:flagellar hook-associated protein FlgL [Bdellovibrio sp. NC01]|uniref:flagellar hook-associated protein FlgL n=1 Tax=Bdellovibrio sp. NC01 TaxID=2220073 RepID=UPI00115BD7D7|nr:flagellar hook-associated protein FlgL [Bdellovibrio sp. NC01]QDK36590.1 flagellar hook-associated protein 3 [Bdellovibrio sp. NC01]
MRIADKMAFNQVNQNLGKNRSDMSDLQNQAATQKRINKPSDDPLSSARVLAARTEEHSNSQFIKNINNAKSFLEFSDQSLGELSDILVRAKELAVSQSNDASGNAETRNVTASEVEQIYNQSIQIGNRKLGERYVFGGFKTQTAPFNHDGDYMGDDGDIKVQTQKDAFVAMNIAGNKVFLGRGLNGDGVVRPRYETPTNVQDLKDFQSEEIQRQQQNQEIEQNYLPTRGPASVSRQTTTGKSDPVTGSAGINIFETLKGLEISLRSNDKDGIQDALDTLDQAISQVVLARSEVGSRIMAVNNTMDSLQKAVVDNKTTASQLEDADAFQVISDINKTDSTLKATLETSGKLIQPSLLDFLR